MAVYISTYKTYIPIFFIYTMDDISSWCNKITTVVLNGHCGEESTSLSILLLNECSNYNGRTGIENRIRDPIISMLNQSMRLKIGACSNEKDTIFRRNKIFVILRLSFIFFFYPFCYGIHFRWSEASFDKFKLKGQVHDGNYLESRTLYYSRLEEATSLPLDSNTDVFTIQFWRGANGTPSRE